MTCTVFSQSLAVFFHVRMLSHLILGVITFPNPLFFFHTFDNLSPPRMFEEGRAGRGRELIKQHMSFISAETEY